MSIYRSIHSSGVYPLILKRLRISFLILLLFSNLPLECGDRYNTSESDVWRRQIMTYKDDARSGRIKIFIMAVDPNAILDLNPNNGKI